MGISEFIKPFHDTQKNQHILIMGCGHTGLAIAEWLTSKTICFSWYDQTFPPSIQAQFTKWKPFLENHWDDQTITELYSQLHHFTDILLSPGIPRNHDLIQRAEKNGIKVWSDIDFFYPIFSNKTIIAVTGTDGKSTTVTLLEHVLQTQYACIACGNNGVPIASILDRVDNHEIEILIIELSSYMLETIYRFRADFFIITNIEPDHLDRYPNFESYKNAKLNIFRYHSSSDIYIQNLDNQHTASFIPENITVIPFTENSAKIGHSISPSPKYFFKNHEYRWEEITTHRASYKADHLFIPPDQMQTILFPSNIFPILITSHQLGLDKPTIQKQILSFQGLPHRLEKIKLLKNLGSVHVYNNSKATTIQSLIASIDYLYRYLGKNIHIILGGKSKDTDFRELTNHSSKIKKAYFYGDAGRMIQEQSKWEGFYDNDFETVVEKSLQNLHRNDILILSPGCSSFDQFKNFEERGKRFKEIILYFDNNKIGENPT